MSVISELRHILSHNTGINISSIIENHIAKYQDMPLKTFVGIMNNQEAFAYMSNSRFCNNPKEFIYHFDYRDVSANFVLGNVLIYLPSMYLYQLFTTIDEYKKYITRLTTDTFDQQILSKQLVLISAEHKFIIKCENKKELINNIKQVLEEYKVKKVVDNLWAQLTFDVSVSSFIQEQNLFARIIDRVRNDSIHVPRHTEADNKFVENDVSIMHDKKYDKILQRLKTIEKYVMQCNVVNNHCIITNGTVNNSALNISQPPITNKKIVEDWIAKNPINDGVQQSEYRAKFLADTSVKIHPNTWGKYASHLIEGYKAGSKNMYRMKANGMDE